MTTDGIDDYLRREVLFWLFVAISLVLYLQGGRAGSIGGWLVARARNAFRFWNELLTVIVVLS